MLTLTALPGRAALAVLPPLLLWSWRRQARPGQPAPTPAAAGRARWLALVSPPLVRPPTQDGLNESRMSLVGGGGALGKRQVSVTDKAAKRSKLG